MNTYINTNNFKIIVETREGRKYLEHGSHLNTNEELFFKGLVKVEEPRVAIEEVKVSETIELDIPKKKFSKKKDN